MLDAGLMPHSMIQKLTDGLHNYDDQLERSVKSEEQYRKAASVFETELEAARDLFQRIGDFASNLKASNEEGFVATRPPAVEEPVPPSGLSQFASRLDKNRIRSPRSNPMHQNRLQSLIALQTAWANWQHAFRSLEGTTLSRQASS